jgi:hypothetical protein
MNKMEESFDNFLLESRGKSFDLRDLWQAACEHQAEVTRREVIEEIIRIVHTEFDELARDLRLDRRAGL